MSERVALSSNFFFGLSSCLVPLISLPIGKIFNNLFYFYSNDRYEDDDYYLFIQCPKNAFFQKLFAMLLKKYEYLINFSIVSWTPLDLIHNGNTYNQCASVFLKPFQMKRARVTLSSC